MDKQLRGGRARLTLIKKRSVNGIGNGHLEICVVEHNERVLPPELEQRRSPRFLPAALSNGYSSRGGPCKRDLLTSG